VNHCQRAQIEAAADAGRELQHALRVGRQLAQVGDDKVDHVAAEPALLHRGHIPAPAADLRRETDRPRLLKRSQHLGQEEGVALRLVVQQCRERGAFGCCAAEGVGNQLLHRRQFQRAQRQLVNRAGRLHLIERQA